MCHRLGCHHSIARILYCAMIAMIAATGLVAGIYSSTASAQATPGAIPFGGRIISFVPPIPNPLNSIAVPLPPCPAHLIVQDNQYGMVAMMMSGFGADPTFDYHNIYTPGVNTLGEWLPIWVPPCFFMPYPVFTMLFNFGYGSFQIGTSLVPGI